MQEKIITVHMQELEKNNQHDHHRILRGFPFSKSIHVLRIHDEPSKIGAPLKHVTSCNPEIAALWDRPVLPANSICKLHTLLCGV